MPADGIQHNALHVRFKGKRNNLGRLRLGRTDNVNEDITRLKVHPRNTIDLAVDQGVNGSSFRYNNGHIIAGIRNLW